MPFDLDIRTGVQTAVILAAVLALFSLFFGVRGILRARNLRFYRMRRDRIVTGWRRIFFALIMIGLAYVLNNYAEPAVYSFYDPSPTPTITPSLTLSPTTTLSPTITNTPTITPTPEKSHTPTITLTPSIPLAIEAQFEGSLDIPEKAVFSPIEFTEEGVDALYRPIEPSAVFTNPLQTMYAVFSYDGMEDGVQWSALWFRNGQLVNFETKPWDGGTGGIGFSDWAPRAEEWLPGEYQVQLFVGLEWLRVGFFDVVGDPPTPTPTSTRTPTDTPTPTETFTPSPMPTSTNTPSRTPWLSPTRTPSITTWPTQTRTPSRTPTPSSQVTDIITSNQTPTSTQNGGDQPGTPSRTPWLSPTRTPSITTWPTQTRTITPTPTETVPSPTTTSTRTPRPTPTITPTPTPWPTVTPSNTSTPRLWTPTYTPSATLTRQPTATPITPTATITRRPTATPINPQPTLTPTPTATFPFYPYRFQFYFRFIPY